MSKWLIIKNGIVENIITASEDYAKSIGAVEVYHGYKLGDIYDPNNTVQKKLESLMSAMTYSIEEGLTND